MSLADTRKDFVAGRAARGLAGRKLFQEKAPGALRSAVVVALRTESRDIVSTAERLAIYDPIEPV